MVQPEDVVRRRQEFQADVKAGDITTDEAELLAQGEMDWEETAQYAQAHEFIAKTAAMLFAKTGRTDDKDPRCLHCRVELTLQCMDEAYFNLLDAIKEQDWVMAAAAAHLLKKSQR